MTKTLSLLEKSKKTVIDETRKVLARGGLVVFPSDTVYGLLVDATNENAVKKLIRFKNRPHGKAISVFIPDLNNLHQYVQVDHRQDKIIRTLLPGPFTVILKSKHQTSKLLESENGTLGVRVPFYPLIFDLLNIYQKPATATSANIGGRSPHYSIDSLLKYIPQEKQNLIDLIVDGGKLTRNKPSTIVDLTNPKIKVLRRGDVELKNPTTYISQSAKQTQKIACFLVGKYQSKTDGKPLVFIIQGDLGVGKTEFVKGAATNFQITNIISPTFVVYYEYEINTGKLEFGTQKFYKFIHYDLYNIEDAEEFRYLGLDEALKDGSIVFIEWGEKLGEEYKKIKKQAKAIYITIKHIDRQTREIHVAEQGV